MMGWKYDGRERPPFAQVPLEGQESVWDYPRPPRLVTDSRDVIVRAGDAIVARSTRAIRVLETASPPTFYLSPDDVRMEWLRPAGGLSHCEWKGDATYWTVDTPAGLLERAAWSYPEPTKEFEPIRNWIAFYPSLLDCSVDGALVRPQPGRFYGGWVTPEIVGPVKGERGSEWW